MPGALWIWSSKRCYTSTGAVPGLCLWLSIVIFHDPSVFLQKYKRKQNGDMILTTLNVPLNSLIMALIYPVPFQGSSLLPKYYQKVTVTWPIIPWYPLHEKNTHTYTHTYRVIHLHTYMHIVNLWILWKSSFSNLLDTLWDELGKTIYLLPP